MREHTAIVDNCNKEVTIHQRHSYDHIGRLLQTYHQINEEEEVLICEKSYNERDELAQKRLGVTALIESSSALQTVDYEYNIRKWLTKINDLSDTDDLFAMELKYTENIAGNFNNDINYNGNITAVEWKFQSDANSKIYSYEYDDLNRLTTAVYGEHDGTSFLNKNRYNSGYSYDENGNILTLERKGLIQNNVFATIDNMTYSYTDDGRLQQIEETSQKARGFKTAASNGIAQYAYDANGNMIQDEHKEILVNYNYLSLPTNVEKVDEGDILWSYDATGKKLSKQVTKDSLLIIGNPIPDDEYNANLITSTGSVAAGSDVSFIAADSIVLKAGFSAKHDFLAKINLNTAKVRHYCNGIEYFERKMEAIYHEARRVFFEDNLPVYEYTLSDHLGNTRVVFSDDGTGDAQELQKNDYYAFGLPFESQQNAYGYTFGHKEEQNELGLEWLDFGARCLARDIGRWMSIDLLAEDFYSMSSYNFVNNNPTRFIDPTGLEPEDLILKGEQSAIDKFISQVNEGLGEYASISIDEDGKVSLSYNENAENATQEQKELANILDNAIDPTNSGVTINLVENSEEVFVGSYSTEAIDVDDTAVFGSDGEFATSQGFIAHEVAEQTEKQCVYCLGGQETMRGYEDSHYNIAIPAENATNGSTRLGRWSGSTSKSTSKMINGKRVNVQNGTFGVLYKKNGKTGLVAMYVKNNNITGVDQVYGKKKK
ncbi:MAG: RHS repeat-associated core domain-containing protein [Bacteroidota bacterium]